MIRARSTFIPSRREPILAVVVLGALSAGHVWGQAAQGSETKLEQDRQQIKQLETKIEELDQKIRVAERRRELENEALAATVQETPVVQANRDGFWFKSANGDFQLKAGGYLHSDGRFYPNDAGNQAVDTFVLRRVRPLFQGTLYKFIEFRLMPDFGEGRAALQDAYLELRYFPKARIRAGKFKAPFGLERLQSATDLAFIERGLPTNLVPNRDLGIQVSGDILKNRLNYAIGVFNGTPDGGSVDAACHDAKDFVARLFGAPFRSLPAGHPLKGLGIGLAASRGRQHGGLPAFKTAGQLAFFSYSASVTASGFRTRLSPQFYYYYGPLGLIAEIVRSEQEVEKGATGAFITNKSWQVATSYFFTGEAKSYKSVAPSRPFDPVKGGWGAWELVARVEELAVDPRVYALGAADPAKAARKAQAWGAGVNWYLNKNVRLGLDYEETRFTGGAAGGNRSLERTLLDRFQVVF